MWIRRVAAGAARVLQEVPAAVNATRGTLTCWNRQPPSTEAPPRDSANHREAVSSDHVEPVSADQGEAVLSGRESVQMEETALVEADVAGKEPLDGAEAEMQVKEARSSSSGSFRERRVPSGQIERVLGFGGLAASLVFGAASEFTRKALYPITGGAGSAGAGGGNSAGGARQPEGGGESLASVFVNERNAERLAAGLCRMRGAALKVGQMLSIQDEAVVPKHIQEVFNRVRDGADVMPKSQLLRVVAKEFGQENWKEARNVSEFEELPIGAASFGQVHRAVWRGKQVAMKIQYPGVAKSIDSDINSLKTLLLMTNIFPKGLYLDEVMKVAKDELTIECDYTKEAANQRKFQVMLGDDSAFRVPDVIDELSTKRILTTEFVQGVPLDRLASADLSIRNHVTQKLLSLCLKELFVWRFMQTDPNWSNFLYGKKDDGSGVIHLIDFGACQEFRKEFVDDYLRMVLACAEKDREGVIEFSRKLGFITGDESKLMLDAHVDAAFVVGEPFASDEPYDFGSQNMTSRLANLSKTMIQHRLTPPPTEAYTLHRKLSGAFLTCIKLNSKLSCRQEFLDLYNSYKF